jgi:uncharacterized protein YndB with AHSA1/START domain
MTTPNTVGKTQSQGWEIGVSRTLRLSAERAWALILGALGMTWDVLPEQAFDTADGTRVEVRSFQHSRLLRMKWQPPGWVNNSTLQIRIKPAKTGTTISIHHEWLHDGEQRETMRLHWTQVLDDIRASAIQG